MSHVEMKRMTVQKWLTPLVVYFVYSQNGVYVIKGTATQDTLKKMKHNPLTTWLQLIVHVAIGDKCATLFLQIVQLPYIKSYQYIVILNIVTFFRIICRLVLINTMITQTEKRQQEINYLCLKLEDISFTLIILLKTHFLRFERDECQLTCTVTSDCSRQYVYCEILFFCFCSVNQCFLFKPYVGCQTCVIVEVTIYRSQCILRVLCK